MVFAFVLRPYHAPKMCIMLVPNTPSWCPRSNANSVQNRCRSVDSVDPGTLSDINEYPAWSPRNVSKLIDRNRQAAKLAPIIRSSFIADKKAGRPTASTCAAVFQNHSVPVIEITKYRVSPGQTFVQFALLMHRRFTGNQAHALNACHR